MKVLFAVHDEKVSLSIVKKYQREYKEIISYKNVYYYNAILKELQRDKTYDRVIIDEELEEFTSTSYEEKDKFIFNKLDSITDEASNSKGKDIPIILICSERRRKAEEVLVKLFGIGIYNAIIGNDRSTDEVCRLINSPRSKKEAKVYYQIDSKTVEYDPEGENDVSEEEMQHILSYFRKLGKKQDKYQECFRKIVSQYNENQMKIIIASLTPEIKEVLEEVSPEYQRLTALSGKKKTTKRNSKSNIGNEPARERLLESNETRTGRPIVVPSTLDKSLIKKVTLKRPSAIREFEDDNNDDDDDFEDISYVEEQPKRRGRPATKALDEDEVEETVEKPKKRGRGRPPKKQIDEKYDNQEQFSDLLPGLDEEEIEEKYEPINEDLLRPEPISDDVLPGVDYDDEEDDNDELDYKENEYEEKEEQINDDINSLPGFEEDEEEYDEEEDEEETYRKNYNNNNNYEFNSNMSTISSNVSQKEINPIQNNLNREIQRYEQNSDDYDFTNYNSLLSSDRKVVAFVGTSKNGTSFIVNNVAKLLAENGIDTAILDATQNRNSYYIFNNNDDSLRNDAANSINNLIKGNSGGMKAAKNLTVYVEVPGQDYSNMYNAGPILENIAKKHSAILIDCDFNTPAEYFANAQEIFLVQSMDVLTIQPLTAFLKELKNKDVLEQSKIRVIINKAMRLRMVTPKQILGGMSRYNNPEMSMMTDLFDRNLIVPIEIPFDENVYAKYIEGIAECVVSVNKYPKEFQNILKKLAAVIYPLLPAMNTKNKYKKDGYQYNTNGFSNNVNNTLNNMRKNY